MSDSTASLEAARQAIREADEALTEGDYGATVRSSVEAYRALIAARPELAQRPPNPALRRQGPLIPDMPRVMRAGHWPSTMGVALTFDDQERPVLTFQKERFTMSEAIAYFEYTRDLVEAAVKS